MMEADVEAVLHAPHVFFVIGLDPCLCSVDFIREAYLSRCLGVHPDKCCHPKAGAAFKQLRNAYEIVSERSGRDKTMKTAIIQLQPHVKYYTRATELAAVGKWKDALAEFEASISACPAILPADVLGLGRSVLCSSLWTCTALCHSRQATGPHTSQATVFEHTLTQSEKALELHRSNIVAAYLAGWAALRLGRHSEAYRHARTASAMVGERNAITTLTALEGVVADLMDIPKLLRDIHSHHQGNCGDCKQPVWANDPHYKLVCNKGCSNVVHLACCHHDCSRKSSRPPLPSMMALQNNKSLRCCPCCGASILSLTEQGTATPSHTPRPPLPVNVKQGRPNTVSHQRRGGRRGTPHNRQGASTTQNGSFEPARPTTSGSTTHQANVNFDVVGSKPSTPRRGMPRSSKRFVLGVLVSSDLLATNKQPTPPTTAMHQTTPFGKKRNNLALWASLAQLHTTRTQQQDSLPPW
eukprot:TRINITY_DN59222_c0_g1_i1.p1 TRINITY_DN59222_c0_g1~~TRINITY_DN59222_c0_g1_i1.p1  ORF type:complete len:468 (+),score=5.18 TRINITY_DN59222_c0_g1_i1:28-1431(+)